MGAKELLAASIELDLVLKIFTKTFLKYLKLAKANKKIHLNFRKEKEIKKMFKANLKSILRKRKV